MPESRIERVILFTVAVALLVSALGFCAGFARVAVTWPRRLTFHLYLVTTATVMLQFLGVRLGTVVTCSLVGAWVALLAFVHAGHALAISNWGAPLHRDVLRFGLRNARALAATAPRETARAAAVLTLSLGSGGFAAWADLRAGTLVPQQLGLPNSLLLIGMLFAFLALIVRVRRLKLAWDPLFHVLFGTTGPEFTLPPLDPVLEEPEQQREVRPATRPATVVIVVIDSLRARCLSFHGYHRQTTPFLASCVAARGARAVTVAVSPCPSSETATWSLLTSRGYRQLAVNGTTLHNALRQAGYRTHFLLSGAHRGWMGLEVLFGTGHDRFVDGCSDQDVIAETAKLPPRETASRGDFFYFHLMSVHTTARVESRYERWLPAQSRVPYLQEPRVAPRVREELLNYYDNAVVQADDYVRQICSLLEQKGYLRDAIVIVTADHGEALGERPGELLGHARNLFQESIHVPLVLMDTAQPLPDVALIADLTDIAPTIARLIGVTPPASWQGQSILQAPHRHEAHVELTTHRRSLPNGRRREMEAVLALLPAGLCKMMWHREGAEETLRAAYCLSIDPDETQPIAGGAIVAGLEALRLARRNGPLWLPTGN